MDKGIAFREAEKGGEDDWGVEGVGGVALLLSVYIKTNIDKYKYIIQGG